jgi:hypothetical protein
MRCPVGEATVVVLWLFQWNREGARARSRKRVEGEERAVFAPEHALAVDPGGVIAQDPEAARLLRSSRRLRSRRGCSGRGRAGDRQGPGQPVEAVP